MAWVLASLKKCCHELFPDSNRLGTLRRLEKKIDTNVADGFPGYVIDEKQRNFTGGGISSSMDLALRILELTEGTTAAQRSQFLNEYSPEPSVQLGSPDTAPPRLVQQLGNGPFVSILGEAVDRLLKI